MVKLCEKTEVVKEILSVTKLLTCFEKMFIDYVDLLVYFSADDDKYFFELYFWIGRQIKIESIHSKFDGSHKILDIDKD